MKIWVVVAVSCSDCNSIGAAAFDHEPSEAERHVISADIDGMFCVTEHVFGLELNGEPASEDLHP